MTRLPETIKRDIAIYTQRLITPNLSANRLARKKLQELRSELECVNSKNCNESVLARVQIKEELPPEGTE